MYNTTLEGPLNCLSINKHCSHVVVAGRNVFKVFTIDDNKFVEKLNLRTGRNLKVDNLNFSALDVTWNPVEDHLLASAASNGAVVTWNLNKSTRSKQDLIFTAHKRTVNKVCFHANEHHLLMSGSQDGSMKLFDLRKVDVSSSFHGKSEYVRDVQFSPHHYFTFAAAFENGNVQIWDMRNPLKWEKQFTAHSGPVFSIDWHPEDKNWIATGGRDKMVKVWDLQNPSKMNIHNVQTIASVARIKWRPQRRYHIASCALLLDCGINVWDIRRPYIPFAAFNEHKDVATGIVWKQNDPHVFFSSSKDCTLVQHLFRDATRPADSANPVAIDINIQGDVAHASSGKLLSTTSKAANYSQTKLPTFFRKAPGRSDEFTTVSSSLTEFTNNAEGLCMDWFIQSAKCYQLSGKSLEDLCDHNAKVALDLDRHQTAQTWKMLKLLYSETPSTPVPTSKSVAPHASKTDQHKESESERVKPSIEGKVSQESKTQDTANKEIHHGDVSTGVSEEESDVQEIEMLPRGSSLANIASGLGSNSHSDFFFGDTNVDHANFEYINNAMQNGQDWNLPTEAFPVRQEIEERGSIDAVTESKVQDSPSSANDSDFLSHVHLSAPESTIKQELLSATPFLSQIRTWHFTELVCKMLVHYAEQGDVQMAVSVLIVLGEKIRSHVDEMNQEHWLISYIDLLGRFRLWSIATEIIKLSNHPTVGSLNQQSTTIHTNCTNCSKPLLRAGWLCDRCKTYINTCSICHHPVKGLYVWCQGCSHGGHLEHIREWLTKYAHCPAGCGHFCEYT